MNINSAIDLTETAAKGYTKTYATAAAMAKGTAELDAQLAKAEGTGFIRKQVVAIPEGPKAGRLTALYILSGDAVSWACHIATKGFVSIG